MKIYGFHYKMMNKNKMTKIDRLLTDEHFQTAIKNLERLEKDRVFCRHGLNHCLDVARIACILSMEEHLDVPKELIYGAALIHDLGRSEEYVSGEPHDIASVKIGRPLLLASGFSEGETDGICRAIAAHRKHGGCDAKYGERNAKHDECDALSALLYRADKLSRPCFLCSASEECYWDEAKKNKTIYR